MKQVSSKEAVTAAEAALAQHFEVMAEMNVAIPAPGGLTAITVELRSEALALMLIPARLPARAVRLNITMDPGLIEEIDAASSNRSAFIAEAARNELARRAGSLGSVAKKRAYVPRNPATGEIVSPRAAPRASSGKRHKA